MSLRDKITRIILNNHKIPEDKRSAREFYYKSYEDNLFCSMGKRALDAYNRGSGGETTPKNNSPAKMASIASSSAMTFNLFVNDKAIILENDILNSGEYEVEYEKQMHTLVGTNPANLDAFLSDEKNGNAIFCEMKMLEWLSETPFKLPNSYFLEKKHFKENKSAVPNPKNAFNDFVALYNSLEKIGFKRYDSAQMLKHLISIYNYTSLVTKDSINSFNENKSMAGKYKSITLLNVVNELDLSLIEDEKTKAQYEKALLDERKESQLFIDAFEKSGIIELFKSNCNADIRVKYISTEQFVKLLEMPNDRREYLKRYYAK